MRVVSMIFGMTFLFMSVLPVTQAWAGKDRHMENPCGKMMNPCDQKEYMERHMQKKKMKARMMQLMEEGMAMWVETVQLVKESASDPGIRQKAAALEKRMQTNVNEHKELHKKMHEMKGGHDGRHMGRGHDKGHKHGDDANPCGMKGM